MTTTPRDASMREFLVRSGVMRYLDRIGLKKPLGELWHLSRNPHAVSRELKLLADYWMFKRRYGSFLGRGADCADPQKKVLIISVTNWVWQVKAEAILAKALQLRGYTPVIATYRGCRWAQQHFGLAGLRRFVYLDDYLTSGEMRGFLMRNPIPAVELPITFASLKGIEYAGVPVGVHVLSSLLARFQRGHLDLSDTAVIQQAQELMWSSCQQVPAVRALLDHIQPEKLLFLEKGYYPFAVFFDVALERRLDVIQWAGAGESDAYCLKRYTLENRKDHPFSLSGQTWDAVKNMSWTREMDEEVERIIRRRYDPATRWSRDRILRANTIIKNPEQVRAQLGLDRGKKTAVIFSHILWDATFFYGENLFEDYEQWLVATVGAACRNAAVNWVIKLHPDYTWKLRRSGSSLDEPGILRAEFGQLPDHVKVMLPDSDIDTFSLFGVTDYAVTVRGTIGIEMSCFGIPIFTAGTGRYSNMGFTIDSTSCEEYLAKMERIHEFGPLSPEQVRLARKHAYVLYRLRPLKVKTFSTSYKPLKSISEPLYANIELHVDSFDDLAVAADLTSFAAWVITSREPDFIVQHPDHGEGEGVESAQHGVALSV